MLNICNIQAECQTHYGIQRFSALTPRCKLLQVECRMAGWWEQRHKGLQRKPSRLWENHKQQTGRTVRRAGTFLGHLQADLDPTLAFLASVFHPA